MMYIYMINVRTPNWHQTNARIMNCVVESYWRKGSSNWKEALKSTRVSEETLAPPWWNTLQSIATSTLSKSLWQTLGLLLMIPPSNCWMAWGTCTIKEEEEWRPFPAHDFTCLHATLKVPLKGSRESTPQTYSRCKQHLWPVTCFWEADTLSPGEVHAIVVV